MHTNVGCETPDGKCSENTFKIDTGADGNLISISMFTKLFSHVSLDTLKRTIDRNVMLYAYNNSQIKQYGTCNVKLRFKGRTTIGNYFVVEHETAIIGIHDAEKLGLIRVNFNLVEEEKIKIIDEVKESQEFKNQVKEKYPELFKGIGLMKGEINIKLKDGAVPHIEPVRRVIGTVYRNYHHPALIIIIVFPDLPPKILRTSSQEHACPARTYGCLAKHYSK